MDQAQNVGNTRYNAFIMRQALKNMEPVDRLKAAGIVGFFRAAQLEEAGLTRDQIRSLLRSGSIEWVHRGLYRLADAEPTENYSLAMACSLVPNSIVCLLSALRVQDIGTQAPAEV